jgi:hypothetical protein
MRRFFNSVFAVTILVAWTAPVDAAGKAIPEEGAIEVMLLRQQSVQKELKLSDDEIEKIHNYCAKQWEKAQEVSKLSEKEQEKKFTEMTKENEHFVATTLTKEQAKRLHQITLQVAGLLCLSRNDIASKLKLTEAQKKELPKIHIEARQEVEDLIHATSKQQKREKLSEIRKINNKRLMELLTDEQEVAWKEMIGEPFKGDIAIYDPEQAAK